MLPILDMGKGIFAEFGRNVKEDGCMIKNIEDADIGTTIVHIVLDIFKRMVPAVNIHRRKD